MQQALLQTIFASAALAGPIFPRLFGNPPLATGCAAGDLTPDNWNGNTIDITVGSTLNFGQSAGFPKTFIQTFNNRLDFDCTDLNFPEKCTLPSDFSSPGSPGQFDGTICGGFVEPRVAFIGQAWVNLYTTLRNIHFATEQAVNDILNSNFIDDIVTQSTAEPLPIPKSVLLRISKLSLSFIPTPAGPELAAFKSIVPKLVKFAGKVINNARGDAEDQEENISNQPQILRDLLASIPEQVKQAVQEQHLDVFVNSHTAGDTSQIDILKGGMLLTPPLSQQQYYDAITRNLKIFLVAQLWTKISMTVLGSLVNPGGAGCVTAGSRQIRDGCFEVRYPDGTTGVTLATGEIPRNPGGVLNSVGLNFDTMVNNALDCRAAGKTFADADFENFLTNATPDSQAIPACLFGLPLAGRA